MKLVKYLIVGLFLSSCSSITNRTIIIQPQDINNITELTTEERTLDSATILPTETPSLPSIFLSDTRTNTPKFPTAGKDRYYETDGTTYFSYIPPLGWTNIPPGNGRNLHMWVLFDEKSFQSSVYACSLFFIIYYPGNISAEAFAYRELVNNPGLDTEVDSAGKFFTNAGIDAYKVVLFRTFTNGDSSEIYYILHKEEAMIYIQYIRSYGLDLEQDIIVENSIKTIVID